MPQQSLDKIYSRLKNANNIALDASVARWYREDVPQFLAIIQECREENDGD